MRILIIIFLLLNFSLSAQEYAFRQIDENIAFPSDEVFDILQDSRGFIWLATSYGVVRYNGFESQSFTTEDGLISNSIIHLYEDVFNRIWFISHKKGLSYWENGVIRSHYLNPRIISMIDYGIIEGMSVDSAGTIYISRNLGGIYKIESDGEIEECNCSENEIFDIQVYNYFLNDYLLNFNVKRSTSEVFNIESSSKIINIVWQGSIPHYHVRKRFYKHVDNNLFLSVGNRVVHISDNIAKATYDFLSEVTDIKVDEHNRLWISTLYDGVYVFSDFDFKNIQMHILKGQSISKMLFDRQQNIWITTLGSGVLFLANTNFEIFNPVGLQNFSILSLEISGDKIYLTNYEHQLWELDLPEKKYKLLFETANPLLNLKDIKIIDKDIFLLGSQFYNLNTEGEIINWKKGSGRKLEIAPNSDLYLLLVDRIVKKENKGIWQDVKLPNPMLFPTCMQFDNDTDFWLGTSEGLYKYVGDTVINYSQNFTFLNEYIADIVVKPNVLYVSIKGVGLGVLKGDSLNLIQQVDGLSSNFINDIAVQNDSVVWTANNNGLNRIVFDKDYNYSIDYFNEQSGLPSANLKSLAFCNDELWLGSTKGLVKIKSPNLVKHKIGANVIIDSVLINSSSVEISEHIEILNNKQSIEFYFQVIGFLNNRDVKLQYSVDNGSKKDILGNYLKLSNFKHLRQDIKFFVVERECVTKFYSLQLSVREEFQESVYFQFTVLAVFLAIMLVVTKLAVSFVRKRAISKEQYLRNKQKALITQINPRFFYASIDTIRHLLNKGKTKAVDEYLKNFTELLRNILLNANYNIIHIEKEIGLIEYYLSLAKVRYKNNLDIEFETSYLSMGKKIYIPPMLVLAVVDAFIDGLNPIYNHKIRILIEQQGDNCLISVEFTVYGRESVGRFISSEKTAFIEKRVSLVNRLYGSSIKFNYDLLEDRTKRFVSERRNFILPVNIEQSRRKDRTKVFRLFF